MSIATDLLQSLPSAGVHTKLEKKGWKYNYFKKEYRHPSRPNHYISTKEPGYLTYVQPTGKKTFPAQSVDNYI